MHSTMPDVAGDGFEADALPEVVRSAGDCAFDDDTDDDAPGGPRPACVAPTGVLPLPEVMTSAVDPAFGYATDDDDVKNAKVQLQPRRLNIGTGPFADQRLAAAPENKTETAQRTTEEVREAERAKHAAYMRIRHAAQPEEEREARRVMAHALVRVRHYVARRAAEPEEEREARRVMTHALARVRHYVARRAAQSEEEREPVNEKQREYNRARCAAQSEEEKGTARSEEKRAQRAKKRACKRAKSAARSEEEKEAQRAKERARWRARRAAKSEEERAAQRVKRRARCRACCAAQPEEEREARRVMAHALVRVRHYVARRAALSEEEREGARAKHAARKRARHAAQSEEKREAQNACLRTIAMQARSRAENSFDAGENPAAPSRMSGTYAGANKASLSPGPLPHSTHPYPRYPCSPGVGPSRPWPGPPPPPGHIFNGARVPPPLGLGPTMLVPRMTMVVPPGAVIPVAVPAAPYYYNHPPHPPLPHLPMGMPLRPSPPRQSPPTVGTWTTRLGGEDPLSGASLGAASSRRTARAP